MIICTHTHHLNVLFVFCFVCSVLVAHTWASPFEHRLLDTVEFISLGNSFVTFMCGQFLFVPEIQQDTNARVAITALILGGNIVFYSIAFSALAKAIKMSKKMKAQESGAPAGTLKPGAPPPGAVPMMMGPNGQLVPMMMAPAAPAGAVGGGGAVAVPMGTPQINYATPQPGVMVQPQMQQMQQPQSVVQSPVTPIVVQQAPVSMVASQEQPQQHQQQQ